MRVKDIKITQNLSVTKLIELTEVANKFESEIHIVGKHYKVDAKSLMGLLATIRNEEVTILTKGEDEEEAIKEFMKLLI